MKRQRTEYKSLAPRIHEVTNHGNRTHQFNIRTDYKQQLWPPNESKEHNGISLSHEYIKP